MSFERQGWNDVDIWIKFWHCSAVIIFFYSIFNSLCRERQLIWQALKETSIWQFKMNILVATTNTSQPYIICTYDEDANIRSKGFRHFIVPPSKTVFSSGGACTMYHVCTILCDLITRRSIAKSMLKAQTPSVPQRSERTILGACGLSCTGLIADVSHLDDVT